MGILKDNRKYQAMTVAEVDDIFLKIARVTATIEHEEAAHKQQLADLELAHKAKLDTLVAEKRELTTELERAVMANQERYETSRTHQVGRIGAYGIKTAPPKVEIRDLDALVQFALENGYLDLIQTKHTPVKRAILKRIMAGEEIPGAKVIPAGDVVDLSFRKGYAEHLEEA